MTVKKLLIKLLNSQKNVMFTDFKKLVEAFGFTLDRTNGSHHIFKHAEIKELINLQNISGQAKPYQIKQFLRLIEAYDLKLKEPK